MNVLQYLIPPTRRELIDRLENSKGKTEFLSELRLYQWRCFAQMILALIVWGALIILMSQGFPLLTR